MSDTRLIASSSQTIGPFFHFGPGDHPQLATMVGPDTDGERIHLRVQILDGAGEPVTDALVEVWQADAAGQYPKASVPGQPPEGFHGFGRMPTDANGIASFTTIRPGRVAADEAAHVNLCIFMRGMLRHIYTRLYFDDDDQIDRDPVLGLVPADRRVTLLAHRAGGADDAWSFEIHLQGDQETVFFDL